MCARLKRVSQGQPESPQVTRRDLGEADANAFSADIEFGRELDRFGFRGRLNGQGSPAVGADDQRLKTTDLADKGRERLPRGARRAALEERRK